MIIFSQIFAVFLSLNEIILDVMLFWWSLVFFYIFLLYIYIYVHIYFQIMLHVASEHTMECFLVCFGLISWKKTFISRVMYIIILIVIIGRASKIGVVGYNVSAILS